MIEILSTQIPLRFFTSLDVGRLEQRWIRICCSVKKEEVKITKTNVNFHFIKKEWFLEDKHPKPLFISLHMKYCRCLHKSQTYSGISNPMLILRYVFRAPPEYSQFFVFA
jgi:hypothetical protein